MILVYSAGEYSDHFVEFVDCSGWTLEECASLRCLLQATGDESLTVHGAVESVAWWDGELTPSSDVVVGCHNWRGKSTALVGEYRAALSRVAGDLDQAVERRAERWKNCQDVMLRVRKEDEAFVREIRKFLGAT